MTVLDIVLLVLLLAYAVSGFRQGLVVGLCSVVGFVAGAAMGMALLPGLVATVQPGVGRLLLVVLGVLAVAWLGQVLGVLVGSRLRTSLTWRPAQFVDAALGALAGVAAVALVVWFVAGALRGGPSVVVARAVASSQVVSAIDALVPERTSSLFAGFRSAVEGSAFPRVFSGLGPERIAPVDPPDAGLAGSEAVAAAAASVVKVSGVAECSRGQEGTGWVLAQDRVLTNAHVVAGIDEPVVQVGGIGERLPGEVVVFDAARDLAVIAVPGLDAPALPRGSELGTGDDAVVAGFPRNGPYRLDPARVREVVDARGEDIYGRSVVIREIYALFGRVEPGNSGGPLLDEGGRVVGVIFARSLDDVATAYALTLDEAAPVLAAAGSSAAVDTGDCAG